MRAHPSEAEPWRKPGVLFCFGFGYSARALAAQLAPAGWQIHGTARSAARLAEIAATGATAHSFDRGQPLTDLSALMAATHILSSVPPDEAGDPVLDAHAADLAQSSAAWVGYLSTTGVYGDRQGGWVEEDDALRPVGPRQARRVTAEAGWRALGLPLHIFRLAGIYGPGRSAIDTVRSGRAQRVVKPGQVFARIHVDDIATVLAASIARPNPGAIYNVADNEPAPPQDVILYACQLLGVTPPPEIPFDAADLSPMARSFYAESKRVSNRRIREELGVTLRYPTYREGLVEVMGFKVPAKF
ncbi:MAG: SDR family oxidoreductase [Alphaproteobacteria bacterium]|nr:SDR family oxidoreductase [Alphaproteobacteria bacterium]